MAYREPVRRGARTSMRSSVLGAMIAVLLVATPIAAACHLLGGKAQMRDRRARTFLPPGRWPAQGQAAIVVGDGKPAVSPHQQPAPIASLAKVMTAYLTLKAHPLSGSGDGFTVTVTAAQGRAEAEEAADGASVVAVRAGERLTERELLEALLIPSGNNVARMLATEIPGSEADFVEEMNAEADALGMTHTTYTDPSGFDPRTVSTAADQLRVFRRAMRFPAFRRRGSGRRRRPREWHAGRRVSSAYRKAHTGGQPHPSQTRSLIDGDHAKRRCDEDQGLGDRAGGRALRGGTRGVRRR